MKKLPIGIQTFEELIKGGYLYVDKTRYIHKLIQAAKYIFLARPRRFGKSLMLSTLKALFEGKEELFAGTWIKDQVDWQTIRRPIIYIDYNAIDYDVKGLEKGLTDHFRKLAAADGIHLQEETAKSCLGEWIETNYRNGQKPVVLIDEYDKPVTEQLENRDKLDHHIRTLKNIYSLLKAKDAELEFVCITGVSRFGKMSIFSDLNNLKDVSLHGDFTTFLGYTQEELEHYFADYLGEKANDSAWMAAIQHWYDGYSWDGAVQVYNPFSILNFMDEGRFRNYWFDTGTPSFLVKALQEQKVRPDQLDQYLTSESIMAQTDVFRIDAIGLLFQTGYLTIKTRKNSLTLGEQFVLGYPNNEVRLTLSKFLLAAYMNQPAASVESLYVEGVKQAIVRHDWERLFRTLNAILSSIPYNLFRSTEAHFHSMLHVVFTLTGMRTFADIPSKAGRADNILFQGQEVFVFEYKKDKPAQLAIDQILQKKYYEPYLLEGKQIFAIGVSFNTTTKRIDDWKVSTIGEVLA